MIIGPNYRIDSRGVLSIKVDDAAGHDNTFTSGGEWFAPYRRLLSSEQLATELADADFTIHSRGALEQKDPCKPMLMQVRAGLRPA